VQLMPADGHAGKFYWDKVHYTITLKLYFPNAGLHTMMLEKRKASLWV